MTPDTNPHTMPKHTHETAASTAGRSNAVALCGRLVGRLSLTSGAAVTCPACKAKQTPAPEVSPAAAAELSDFDSLPEIVGDVTVVLTHALERVAAGEPASRFRGRHADGFAFSARADLFLIQHAWFAGCSFEALADGFGAGFGTRGDWSAIRDSSELAIAKMTAKAVDFILEAR